MTDELTIDDYPELKLLCWNCHTSTISREDAFGLYRNYWRFVSMDHMGQRERQLLAELSHEFGPIHDILESAIEKFSRGECSAARAGSLAGMDRQRFAAELAKRGIPLVDYDPEDLHDEMKTLLPEAELRATATWLWVKDQLLLEESFSETNPSVRSIIAVLGFNDPWELAFWFDSVNSYLGGKRPQDVMQEDPERVIEAARQERDWESNG